MQESISNLLLRWYDAHARILPWRGIQDPYRTWVSETMLQQTRVETVMGYYERFLERFPDVRALAEAPQEDVLKLWEGLGYYSRARNLHKGAQQIMEQYEGKLPADADELRSICGIGPYTAGAIASIAFGIPVPAVDGNVIRVVSRVKGIRENVGIPSVRRMLEREATAIVPSDRPGDFNQAVMDLGATVCTPGTPSCDRCPLQSVCDAFDAGDAEELPLLPRKNPPRLQEYDVFLIFSSGRVLMRQRTEAMLSGMWVYPMLEGRLPLKQIAGAAGKLTKLKLSGTEAAGEGRHVFTHRIWDMKLYALHAPDSAEAPAGYRFVNAEQMAELPIPTAMRAARLAVQEIFSKIPDEMISI